MQKQVLYSRNNGITTFRSLNEVGEVTKTVAIPTLLASPVTDDFKAFPARMLTVQSADISASMLHYFLISSYELPAAFR